MPKIRGIHDTVVVCGNGPSLVDVPHTLFRHPLIGSNSIYKVDYFNRCPVDYYCIEGYNHLKTKAEREARKPYVQKVGEAGGWTFVNRRWLHEFVELPNVWGIDYLNPTGGGKKTNFSYEPLKQHGTGYSVMFFMLQLAHYLLVEGGTALIVGMDHKFTGDSWHPWDDEGPFDAMTKDRKPHWASLAEPYYKMASDAFVDKTLLNLTPGTALSDDIIPHGELEEWV